MENETAEELSHLELKPRLVPTARVVQLAGDSRHPHEGSLLLSLPSELLVVVLEQCTFVTLLSAHATCSRLRDASLTVTRTLINCIDHLSVPILRRFGGELLCLEVEKVEVEWLPRLGCCLALMPKLQRLFVRRHTSRDRCRWVGMGGDGWGWVGGGGDGL